MCIDKSHSQNILHTPKNETKKACRPYKQHAIARAALIRQVECHQDWIMTDDVDVFWSFSLCHGHSVTCGPRNNKLLLDSNSEFLTDDTYGFQKKEEMEGEESDSDGLAQVSATVASGPDDGGGGNAATAGMR